MSIPFDALTPREREVAQEMLRGKRIDLVAEELRMSPRTVETHLGRVYRKLGVTSRAELAAAFVPDMHTTAPDLEGMPPTRYARCGEFNIAYQVAGGGEPVILVVPGLASHLEVQWEQPQWRQFVSTLAGLGTVICFDKRGTGLSDPMPGDRPQSMTERMDDATAILDAVGVERAILFGMSEGAPMSMFYAAAHPERVSGLLLYGATHPHDRSQQADVFMSFIDNAYGTGAIAGSLWPSMLRTREGHAWLARFERYCVSRTQVASILRGNVEIDANKPIPTIDVPTTVVHCIEDPAIPFAGGQALAADLGAKFVPIHGTDHVPWGEIDLESLLDEIRALAGLVTATE